MKQTKQQRIEELEEQLRTISEVKECLSVDNMTLNDKIAALEREHRVKFGNLVKELFRIYSLVPTSLKTNLDKCIKTEYMRGNDNNSSFLSINPREQKYHFVDDEILVKNICYVIGYLVAKSGLEEKINEEDYEQRNN